MPDATNSANPAHLRAPTLTQRGGEADNQSMLRQFFNTLEVRSLLIPAPAPGSPEAAALDKARALIARRDQPGAQWSDAYECEQVLARLAPEADLRPELLKSLEALKLLDAPLAARFEQEYARIDGASFDAAGARGLLARILGDLRWESAQRYFVRRLAIIYARRLVLAFGVAMAAALTLVTMEVYWENWRGGEARFSGFAMAVCAGFLGASFSMLTRQRDFAVTAKLETMRTFTGYPMILLRIGVGVGAAAILYFLFAAGLIAGQVFPDLNGIGFASVGAPQEAANAAALATLNRLAPLLNEAQAQIDAGKAQAALALLDEGRALLAAQPDRALGRFVPNADLSKLVVWCFVAGFSEQFVPTLLARVETDNGAGKKAD